MADQLVPTSNDRFMSELSGSHSMGGAFGPGVAAPAAEPPDAARPIATPVAGMSTRGARGKPSSGLEGKPTTRARTGVGSKRKSRDQDEDDDLDDDDAQVPVANGQPRPQDIARLKYNHIEDEKERKRLKRLLRNRVSAQQARERKKAYMSTLEGVKDELERKCQALELRVSTLERENFMLRQVVKSTTLPHVPKM
mmetsp:Transcript_24942/g.81688  ORF Transcript_24942/g.81688 Transcript_24942/m.81688 type:complete len:196 (-) Transcript_24942:421-1008(-)